MNVALTLPESEALALYRLIHQAPEGEDRYSETYRQLQMYFFQVLTISELSKLLETKD